jgi:hypothetical protein
MGYSARYHAFSIIAIFVALGVGVVIGAGLGSDFVSGTTESLEASLQEDVREVRAREDDLRSELDRERGFGSAVYPSLVGGRLDGDRIGLVGLGGLPAPIAGDVEAALAPTAGRIAEVAVVRLPPDLAALARDLPGNRFRRLEKRPALVGDLGHALGRQLAKGGPLLGAARETLMERFSGDPDRLDKLVLYREPPGDAAPPAAPATTDFVTGILDGIRSTGVEAVAVERTDTSPSSIGLAREHQVPTVDSIDLTSGRTAMVFVLLGAKGSFGVKDGADRLLPDLLLEPLTP